MATVTEYASAASGTSWTNPTNANADDGAYATYTIAAKNTTGNVNTLSNLGFDSSIPANSLINSVTLEVQHKVSTNGGIAFLESALALGATIGTYNSDSAEPTTDTARSYSMARPGGGTWTRADLLDGTLTIKLRARSGNNATSVVYSWDYARVLVDYSPPITGALAATESGSDTASIAGDVLIDGALAATESGGDTAALEGIVTTGGGPVSGALAATEAGADTAAISGDVLVSGALAAAESGSDTASLAGDVLVQGALSVVEAGGDTASLAGDVLVSGALAAVETGQDTAAFAGPPAPQQARRRAGGRRGYIVNGMRYVLNERELAVLLQQIEQQAKQAVRRSQVLEDAPKPKVLSRGTWAKLKQTLGALEALSSPEPVKAESEDDDEEAILMLI